MPAAQPRRAVAFVLLAVLAAPLLPDMAAAAWREAPCDDVQWLHGVGRVCPKNEAGLYEVIARDGASLGFVHGADPPMDEGTLTTAAATTRPPACVAEGTHYSTLVIYARAFDDADGYASRVASIRDVVNASNGMVADAAAVAKDRADLRVQCADGVVVVRNEVLPTRLSQTDFSTIVADLQAKGYADGRMKYWVYFDERSCNCAGIGHIYDDDRLSERNWNNGNGNPMFAVSFGYLSTRVFLHELSHNMGAVQNSAPHATGGFHCTDGRDTMCYDDGGPNSHKYTTSACSTEIYDCGKDDYFNARPAEGSYLASHWNVGSQLNRFLVWGTPSMTSLACPTGTRVDDPITCSFVASDDSAGVYYTIDWGDGTSTRVPASGTVAPGTTQNATHAWAASGSFTISVAATDDESPPATSIPLRRGISVAPNLAPTMTSLDCTAEVLEGQPASCAFVASDDSAGVYYTIDWGDGITERVPPSGYAKPGAQQHANRTFVGAATRDVRVTATDDERTPLTSAALSEVVLVLADQPPAAPALACPEAAAVTYVQTCTFSVADDSLGIAYEIDWGDGTIRRVPASGTVKPGTVQTATHAWAATGTYAVRVRAIDTAPTPQASAWSEANVTVVEDTTPPVLVLRDPAPGGLYVGCSLAAPSVGSHRALLVHRGCARVDATDALTGIARVQVFFGGRLVGDSVAGPYAWEFPTGGARVDETLTVVAIDGAGNVATVKARVDAV